MRLHSHLTPLNPLTLLLTISLLPSPDGTTYEDWHWPDDPLPYHEMETSYTHWRQFPEHPDGTCPKEDWWPNISEDAQYRWLRSQYLDRDLDDGDSYSLQLLSRRWDFFVVISRVIWKGRLDVIKRLVREQAGLVSGSGGAAAVPTEGTPPMPRWSSLGGEDQKFWYDLLSRAAWANRMDAVRFYVEELGVSPFLFPFPKLPREDTRESWAAMDEEAREDEAEDYAYFNVIHSPLESTFGRGSVEAAEYLLNTGLAGEGELSWEGLEEIGKMWDSQRIEGRKERVDEILQLLREQHLVRPGTFNIGITAEVRSQQRCWLSGCPSLVTVLFGSKF